MNTPIETADIGAHMRRRYDGRPSRTYGNKNDFWPPMPMHGIIVSYPDTQADERLYLGQEQDKLLRSVLSLVDAVHDGTLATAIRVASNPRAFGLTLQVGSNVIYVSGEDGSSELTVRVQSADGRVGLVRPIVEPYDGWLSKLPLMVALYKDGTYYHSDGGTEAALVLQEVDSVRREAHELLDTVLDQPGAALPYARRIRRFGDGGNPFDVAADVRIEASGNASIKMYTRRDRGADREVLPIVAADVWSVANRFRAAR